MLPPQGVARWVARAAVVSLAVGFAVALGAPAARAASGPASSVRPTVSGRAVEGNRLRASPGVWSGSGRVKVGYQWYRCDAMGARCVPLRGVTGRSRMLGGKDVGHTLDVRVRATDSRGSTVAYSSLIGPIAGAPPHLASTVQPTVSGTLTKGGVVRVAPGAWKPMPASFTYQWARCNGAGRACTPIPGATDDAHWVAAADLGHALVAIVQARLGATSQAVISLPAKAAVEAAPASKPAATGAGPTAASPPLVAQVVQVGRQVVGATGTWAGSGRLSFAYQWYRCDAAGAHCSSIHGATASTYRLVARDAGQTVGFAVRATDATGTRSAYASLLGPVAAATAALVSTGQPMIAGESRPGATLQVSSGSWSPAPASLGFQWERCNEYGRLCAPIPGASASTYTVAAEDAGHALVVIVRAGAGAAVQDVLSSATAPVAAVVPAGPANTARPTVSGTVQQGKQLAGAAGTWAGSGVLAYAYQWYRCDAAGAHCMSIHGATGLTYTQVARDVGQTLGFAVRATDAAGTTTAHASLVGPVAPPAAPTATTVQPAITGEPKTGLLLQATNGSWSVAPASFAYQWLRCNANGRLCTAITGATTASYAVTAADAGHALVVSVQAATTGAAQAALSTLVLAVA